MCENRPIGRDRHTRLLPPTRHDASAAVTHQLVRPAPAQGTDPTLPAYVEGNRRVVRQRCGSPRIFPGPPTPSTGTSTKQPEDHSHGSVTGILSSWQVTAPAGSFRDI
ncbi:hypothetical protein GCM10027160_10600 [Streptomyces calidiresistens]